MQHPARGRSVSLQRVLSCLRRSIVLALVMLLLADKRPDSMLSPLEWSQGADFLLEVDPNQPKPEELQERFNGAVDGEFSSLTRFESVTESTFSDNLKCVLFAPEGDLTADEIRKEMARHQLRPLGYVELLALAHRFPQSDEIPEAGEVVALDSFAIKLEEGSGLKHSYLPVLTYRGKKVALGMKPFIRVFHWPGATTRFLATPVSSLNPQDAS